MRLDELAQALRDFEARLVELGVSRIVAERVAQEAEASALADLLEIQADLRLLDLFEQVGCQALADRKGVTRKTIYSHRTEALNRLAEKKVCRPSKQLPTQEVA